MPLLVTVLTMPTAAAAAASSSDSDDDAFMMAAMPSSRTIYTNGNAWTRSGPLVVLHGGRKALDASHVDERAAVCVGTSRFSYMRRSAHVSYIKHRNNV